MNTVVEEIVPWIEVLESTIKDQEECPNQFEIRFCNGNELESVSFNSKQMVVVYYLSSGKEFVTYYDIKDFSDWLDEE